MLQWVYTENQGLVKVDSSAILDLFGSNQFMLCPQTFKHCALIPSLLFQQYTVKGRAGRLRWVATKKAAF